MVEASTKLIDYIHTNMKNNSINHYTLYNAICDKTNKEIRTFAQNPFSSQDNRVIGSSDEWIKNKVETISLDYIFSKHPGQFYFIKTDTQGYEPNVFLGGEKFLCTHNNWIIKTEFSPDLIKSQGFSPKEFLEYLLDNYIVCESPHRVSFKGNDLKSIISNNLDKRDINGFIEYISNHNKDYTGWCDLYIFPKNFKLKQKKH